MSTLSELVTRVSLLLQDSDNKAWPEDQKREQVVDEIQKLARMGYFGEIVWAQGVTAAHVVSLPTTVIDVELACYDGRQLYQATERSLALKDQSWEQRANRPQYYTKELAPQTQIYSVPAPLVTGSAVPVMPPLPLFWKIEENFIIFTTDNPQTATGLEQDCTVPDWLEDVLVFRTASKLSGDKGDYQDNEKSFLLDSIASLFLSGMSTDLDLDSRV